MKLWRALVLAGLCLLLASTYVPAAPAAKAAPATAAPTAFASEPAPPEFVKVADEVAKEVEAIHGWKFKEPVKKGL
jgi:hypothetical protein